MADTDLIPIAIESTRSLFDSEAGLVTETALLEWLEEKVADMLDRDFNGLVSLLYMIDVYESKAKTCFGKQNREIAKCLAALIWERQLQKAEGKVNGNR